MTQFYLTVTKETAQFTGPDDLLLTSGSAGVYEVSICADSHWDGLALEAVFVAAPASWPAAQNAAVIRRSAAVVDGVAQVPADVLSKSGYMLYAGLSGTAGDMEKNSTLALIRRIQPGADPEGSGSEDIPQTRYLQLVEIIGSLSDLDTEEKSSLVAAVNAVFAATSDTAISAAVEAYMEKFPVAAPVSSVNGKTGAVELTAKDVEAISQVDLPQISATHDFVDGFVRPNGTINTTSTNYAYTGFLPYQGGSVTFRSVAHATTQVVSVVAFFDENQTFLGNIETAMGGQAAFAAEYDTGEYRDLTGTSVGYDIFGGTISAAQIMEWYPDTAYIAVSSPTKVVAAVETIIGAVANAYCAQQSYFRIQSSGVPDYSYVLTDEDKTEIAEMAAALVANNLLNVTGTGEVTV